MRLNDPDEGKHDVNAPAMFDSPWPMNSWLASSFWPILIATARATDTACASASAASASAPGARRRQSAKSNDGNDSCGIAEGRAPIVRT